MSETLVAVFSCALSLISLLVCGLTLARVGALQKRLAEDRAALEAQIVLAGKGNIGMGKRLQELDKRQSQLSQRLDAVREEATTPAAVITTGNDFLQYSRALELLHSGMALEGVAEACHLSRAEVDLLHLVHQQRDNLPVLTTEP